MPNAVKCVNVEFCLVFEFSRILPRESRMNTADTHNSPESILLLIFYSCNTYILPFLSPSLSLEM